MFVLNRDLETGTALEIDARNFATLVVKEAEELQDADLKAANTKAHPLRIKPAPLKDISVSGRTIRMTLKSASWNVIHLAAP